MMKTKIIDLFAKNGFKIYKETKHSIPSGGKRGFFLAFQKNLWSLPHHGEVLFWRIISNIKYQIYQIYPKYQIYPNISKYQIFFGEPGLLSIMHVFFITTNSSTDVKKKENTLEMMNGRLCEGYSDAQIPSSIDASISRIMKFNEMFSALLFLITK